VQASLAAHAPQYVPGQRARIRIRAGLSITEHNFGLSPLGPNDAQAYPFTNAFNFHQAPLRPGRMIYRKWPADAYHVNLAEGRDDT
jgi:hypothetical protein